jgi:hypothetical protein
MCVRRISKIIQENNLPEKLVEEPYPEEEDDSECE